MVSIEYVLEDGWRQKLGFCLHESPNWPQDEGRQDQGSCEPYHSGRKRSQVDNYRRFGGDQETSKEPNQVRWSMMNDREMGSSEKNFGLPLT